jgi:hypothetical protein
MLKKKNKLFIRKRIQQLLLKKKQHFRFESILEHIKIFTLLSKASILAFFNFVSVKGKKDNNLYRVLFDRDFFYVYIKHKFLTKLFNKKILTHIKKFNNVISFNNILKINFLEKYFEETGVLVSGYYFNNIYFSKEDLNLNNIKKKEFFIKFIKLKLLIKNIFNKIILMLKYCLNNKNGDSKPGFKKGL